MGHDLPLDEKPLHGLAERAQVSRGWNAPANKPRLPEWVLHLRQRNRDDGEGSKSPKFRQQISHQILPGTPMPEPESLDRQMDRLVDSTAKDPLQLSLLMTQFNHVISGWLDQDAYVAGPRRSGLPCP